ncbi:hypothetical protein FV230_24565 [Methylobacterium sp. WL6]|nr:hypothetical protein FV230_24565 [Methylobacterium sp. WL6]
MRRTLAHPTLQAGYEEMPCPASRSCRASRPCPACRSPRSRPCVSPLPPARARPSPRRPIRFRRPR